MAQSGITTSIAEQDQTIRHYYRFQSRIYDLTRWTFLFGRKAIVRALPFQASDHFSLLEVGCGTGYNLGHIARRYPNAGLTGMDLSADMLAIAKKNLKDHLSGIQLQQAPYGTAKLENQPDVILFSYALTMINPQWESLIRQAHADLRPGGYIAVTDFHDSALPWFKRHMGGHHVRMDAHLLPVLHDHFEPVTAEVKKAYGGIWEYFCFVGQKRDEKWHL